FGKWIGLWMVRQQQQSPKRKRVLIQLGSANVAYVAFSLQLYISGAVMLPVLLPSLIVWGLVLQSSRRTLRE
ncbi:MAG: hypothetical protein AAF974_12870, partial [Cyanobacteria bacterium P01_E01_bin.34]